MSVTWYLILMVSYVLVRGQNRKETLEGFKWSRWGLLIEKLFLSI
ncbi:unnamed protein product [Brugia timori]|uniref:Uncharacterized protein n=1 Tax=Brugia timori TaxID=42155 RepID=A0A0R3Q6B4_9BILA|nr:unnamed protein product [Brugia timori]